MADIIELDPVREQRNKESGRREATAIRPIQGGSATVTKLNGARPRNKTPQPV